MAVPQEKLFWTVEEYLEFEKTSDVRHEYVDGVIYAMAGEKRRHNRIAFRLATRLENHLEDTDCEVYFESVKLFTSATKFYYPDVVVTCSEQDDEYSLKNPILIVEVLSPTTERTDRAEKLIAYQKMSSLQEYVLISSERLWLQIYRRTNGDEWTVEQFLNLDDEIKLASINFKPRLSNIYRNIHFPAPEHEENLS